MHPIGYTLTRFSPFLSRRVSTTQATSENRHMPAPIQIDGGTPWAAIMGVATKLMEEPSREKHSTTENASESVGPSNHRAVYAFCANVWNGASKG